MIRKAGRADLDAVEAIYLRIHEQEQAGKLCIGWEPGIYPVRATAEAALKRNDLFVCEENGVIVASAVLNHQQVDVYADGNWEYPAEDHQVMVMHTLTVDPAAARKGIGTGFVEFYEQYARECGCTALRMDTNERNRTARALYGKLGYREIGIVPCTFNGIPGVGLVLLEKAL